MRCSYCSQPAEAKCTSSLKLMCKTHLASQFLVIKNLNIEALNIELGNERLNSQRSKILKEVQKVNILKFDLSVNTRTLIKSTEKLFKLPLAKLNLFSSSYNCILKQNKFTKSDCDTIQKIENIYFKVKTIDIETMNKK